MVSTSTWISFGLVSLLTLTVLVTLLILMLVRTSHSLGPSDFSCSVSTPPAFPACGITEPNSGIPGVLGSGFLTSAGLQVVPTRKPPQSLFPVPRMVGYYHSHPTGYFQQSPEGVLYSYPFVLRVTPSSPPGMHLAAYSYTAQPSELTTQPFEQYRYLATGLDTATSGYTMRLPCVTGSMPALGIDRQPYTSTGNPTLTSMLSSRAGTRAVRVVMNQGAPFMMVALSEAASAAIQYPLLSVAGFAQSSMQVITTSNGTFNAYMFSGFRATSVPKYLVWFVNSTVPQGLSISAGEATLSLGTSAAGAVDVIAYISMFAQVGSLLSAVMQLIANSLAPYFIQLSDIIPSASNTAMQYQVTPMTPYTLKAGISTLWIVPPSSFQIAALAGIVLPAAGYLDFPIGNGLCLTNAQVGSSLTSFFTLWPKTSPSIFDFGNYYTLPNAGSGLTDTSSVVTSDSDLYYLALTIRILFSTPGGQAPTTDQINTCATAFQLRLEQMGVGETDYTLFTQNLGDQDAGLVSRAAYLLLTYLHLYAIKDLLPRSGPASSAYGIIVNAGLTMTMLIESGMTTLSLNSQPTSPVGVRLYASVAFIDTYWCTIPVIKTSAALSPSLPRLTSRLGEVLGYLWACDILISKGWVTGSQNIPRLSRSLYSIVLESTSRLLRGQCVTTSVPGLAPVMPWTTDFSQTAIGFQLDGASPGGTSPDAAILQSFIPFSPPTHESLRPLLSPLMIAVEKLIRCDQSIPQAPPAQYYYGQYVDAILVGYFTYLYSSGDRTQMLLSGRVDADLSPFIKFISLQHPSVALLMNQMKLVTPTISTS